jgi:hypothetical protein
MKYSWLVGSLCVWLLCAWVAQQPVPARKAPAKRGAPAVKATAVKPAPAGVAPTHAAVTAPVSATGVDPESGLALDKNMLLVKGQCTACHSSKLILQSHFDRDKWIERIRWMQRTQKLWDLGEFEPAILDYLTNYYGPQDIPFDGRRMPLPSQKWHSR